MQVKQIPGQSSHQLGKGKRDASTRRGLDDEACEQLSGAGVDDLPCSRLRSSHRNERRASFVRLHEPW